MYIVARRSLFSSKLPRVDGFDIGKQPLVVRLMRGICNTRPPAARYSSTWDVNVVFKYISERLGENDNLRIMQLSAKAALLLALTTLMRISELAAIDVQSVWFSPVDASFSLLKYRKTQRLGSLPSLSTNFPNIIGKLFKRAKQAKNNFDFIRKANERDIDLPLFPTLPPLFV